MNSFEKLFVKKKPILAMIHLKGENRNAKLERAKLEIGQYYQAGVDAVIIEDYFAAPGIKGVLEEVLAYLHKEYPANIYGVNVLDNFHRSYELAALYGAKFLQVDSAAGQLPSYLDVPYGKMIQAYREAGEVLIFGGVRFKYQPVLSGRSIKEDLEIAKARCDAIVVTGPGTGIDTDQSKLLEFKQLLGDFAMLVGAGVTIDTVRDKLAVADGAIVGSAFKDTGKDSGDVDPKRVLDFMKIVQEIREAES
ncbi:MAG: membrane biogenesis protein [Erysipelotrichaceae bacterium]|jgi:predicted TIM-barrel enzyme|nr:membrane biogenesis protein [Erysipelotrichaceae bacterium]